MFYSTHRASMRNLGHIVATALAFSTVVVIIFAGIVVR